jgi:ATP-binding protein involved in chromosome partitioning
VPFLGEIPLVQSVCEHGDKGKPAVLHLDDVAKPYFDSIAVGMATEVSKLTTIYENIKN